MAERPIILRNGLLAGRPGQGTPAEDMAVEMRHGFAAVTAIVDDQPIAGVFQPRFLSDLGSFQEEMTEEGGVLGARFRDPGDGLFWNNQQVGGGLGGDIPKSQYPFVLVNDVRGDLTVDNLFEERHGG